MTSDSTFPPSSFADLVEAIARDAPDSLYCQVLEPDWREKGPRDVTYAQVARAVDALSWWLDERFGPSKDFTAFAYHGESDFRYALLILAAQKTQRKMVIPQVGRLTHDALLSLLDNTSCNYWISGAPVSVQTAAELSSERPGLQCEQLPSLDHWLTVDAATTTRYPYSKTWEEAMRDPLFVIHSSGTTGPPKHYPWTLAMFSHFNACRELSDGTVENPDFVVAAVRRKRILWIPPPTWLGGIMGLFALPLFYHSTPIFPPPDAPAPLPSAHALELLQKLSDQSSFIGKPQEKLTGAFLTPSHARDLCLAPGGLELLRSLDVIMSAGAAMDGWAGDQLFPDRDTHHSEDLYEPHPTKKHLWLHRGRADDLFKLKWMQQVKATDMERGLERHPLVATALVGGEGRPVPFIILELVSGSDEPEKMQLEEEEIESLVHEVNEQVVGQVRIPKDKLIVADPARPFRRLGKGTLDRIGVLVDYKDDIERLYST
ncbi:hypothetical protein PG993_000810 [Apiospora rasikravindrae]|uniref:AMP-dependent synthetase/ligase domain-containing protein n=1 Tax=Apiospora rasikravindrae TaxID=990691 RepID=A0ABR1U9L3_9PEZI